jgi:hypothetical protein
VQRWTSDFSSIASPIAGASPLIRMRWRHGAPVLAGWIGRDTDPAAIPVNS